MFLIQIRSWWNIKKNHFVNSAKITWNWRLKGKDKTLGSNYQFTFSLLGLNFLTYFCKYYLNAISPLALAFLDSFTVTQNKTLNVFVQKTWISNISRISSLWRCVIAREKYKPSILSGIFFLKTLKVYYKACHKNLSLSPRLSHNYLVIQHKVWCYYRKLTYSHPLAKNNLSKT